MSMSICSSLASTRRESARTAIPDPRALTYQVAIVTEGVRHQFILEIATSPVSMKRLCSLAARFFYS
jgi:hypothetical protein